VIDNDDPITRSTVDRLRVELYSLKWLLVGSLISIHSSLPSLIQLADFSLPKLTRNCVVDMNEYTILGKMSHSERVNG
jgi:hypothetical protein